MGHQLSFKGSDSENKKDVGNIWRYATTELLGWTPEEAIKNLDNEIVDRLLLNKTFVGLNFDREHTYIADYRFILQYAFPDQIRYDSYTECISEYEKFAKLGKWSHDPSLISSQRFLYDGDGIHRANWCLRYVISLYMGDMAMDEKYKFFADTQKALKWIKTKNHARSCEMLYESPLSYFHASIKEKDSFLYSALVVRNKMAEIKL